VTLAQEQVSGATVSEAWLNAVQVVDSAPKRRLFHLVTRVGDPVTEELRIRAAADGILRDLDLAPINTVANTIFPSQLAAASARPDELAQRYRRMYPTLRRLHKSNRKGTYFGRIVAHPVASGERDQLADLIGRLKTELRTRGPKSARYEMNISGPGELASLAEEYPAVESTDGGPVHVYAADRDTSPMGFPCLSFCSFQMDGDTLHMVAQYRYQYLIERGYGNYLGLGQLLGYVCAAVGLKPGQLMIIAGVAAVDSAPRYRIARLAEAARVQ
jgi:hypothetical protein